ncbi:MAG: hypothetical protein KDD70_00725 [Bdellovibrionales bacterium]|nr:hypothetical protein [Bdellovibrionales bacterium]
MPGNPDHDNRGDTFTTTQEGQDEYFLNQPRAVVSPEVDDPFGFARLIDESFKGVLPNMDVNGNFAFDYGATNLNTSNVMAGLGLNPLTNAAMQEPSPEQIAEILKGFTGTELIHPDGEVTYRELAAVFIAEQLKEANGKTEEVLKAILDGKFSGKVKEELIDEDPQKALENVIRFQCEVKRLLGESTKQIFDIHRTLASGLSFESFGENLQKMLEQVSEDIKILETKESDRSEDQQKRAAELADNDITLEKLRSQDEALQPLRAAYARHDTEGYGDTIRVIENLAATEVVGELLKPLYKELDEMRKKSGLTKESITVLYGALNAINDPEEGRIIRALFEHAFPEEGNLQGFIKQHLQLHALTLRDESVIEGLTDWVKENPIKSAGAAALGGLALWGGNSALNGLQDWFGKYATNNPRAGRVLGFGGNILTSLAGVAAGGSVLYLLHDAEKIARDKTQITLSQEQINSMVGSLEGFDASRTAVELGHALSAIATTQGAFDGGEGTNAALIGGGLLGLFLGRGDDDKIGGSRPIRYLLGAALGSGFGREMAAQWGNKSDWFSEIQRLTENLSADQWREVRKHFDAGQSGERSAELAGGYLQQVYDQLDETQQTRLNEEIHKKYPDCETFAKLAENGIDENEAQHIFRSIALMPEMTANMPDLSTIAVNGRLTPPDIKKLEDTFINNEQLAPLAAMIIVADKARQVAALHSNFTLDGLKELLKPDHDKRPETTTITTETADQIVTHVSQQLLERPTPLSDEEFQKLTPEQKAAEEARVQQEQERINEENSKLLLQLAYRMNPEVTIGSGEGAVSARQYVLQKLQERLEQDYKKTEEYAERKLQLETDRDAAVEAELTRRKEAYEAWEKKKSEANFDQMTPEGQQTWESQNGKLTPPTRDEIETTLSDPTTPRFVDYAASHSTLSPEQTRTLLEGHFSTVELARSFEIFCTEREFTLKGSSVSPDKAIEQGTEIREFATLLFGDPDAQADPKNPLSGIVASQTQMEAVMKELEHIGNDRRNLHREMFAKVDASDDSNPNKPWIVPVDIMSQYQKPTGTTDSFFHDSRRNLEIYQGDLAVLVNAASPSATYRIPTTEDLANANTPEERQQRRAIGHALERIALLTRNIDTGVQDLKAAPWMALDDRTAQGGRQFAFQVIDIHESLVTGQGDVVMQLTGGALRPEDKRVWIDQFREMYGERYPDPDNETYGNLLEQYIATTKEPIHFYDQAVELMKLAEDATKQDQIVAFINLHKEDLSKIELACRLYVSSDPNLLKPFQNIRDAMELSEIIADGADSATLKDFVARNHDRLEAIEDANFQYLGGTPEGLVSYFGAKYSHERDTALTNLRDANPTFRIESSRYFGDALLNIIDESSRSSYTEELIKRVYNTPDLDTAVERAVFDMVEIINYNSQITPPESPAYEDPQRLLDLMDIYYSHLDFNDKIAKLSSMGVSDDLLQEIY